MAKVLNFYNQTHTLFDEKRINLTSLDIVEEAIPNGYKNADYCILMFVLSAIKPDKHEFVVKKIHEVQMN